MPGLHHPTQVVRQLIRCVVSMSSLTFGSCVTPERPQTHVGRSHGAAGCAASLLSPSSLPATRSSRVTGARTRGDPRKSTSHWRPSRLGRGQMRASTGAPVCVPAACVNAGALNNSRGVDWETGGVVSAATCCVVADSDTHFGLSDCSTV